MNQRSCLRFRSIAAIRRSPFAAWPLVLVAALGGAAHAASDVTAPASSAAMPASLSDPVVREPAAKHDPFEECESAVGRSLRENRGAAVQDLQFATDGRSANADGEHQDVKGSGHYRRGGATIEFHYSCAYDAAQGVASGVVLREGDARSHEAAALPVWQADLSKISPEACESAVADRLQAANARVSGIMFDGGNRKLEPAAEGRTALAGSGRMVRAPGMRPGPFHYRCEFDGSGHLAAASTTD